MTLDSPRGGEADELPSEKQMSNRVRPRLICETCGHTWSPRNTSGVSRHCSKCDSKQIVEVSGDNVTPPPEIAPKKAEVVVKEISVSPLMKDDPDIRQKMKELELARLERQIEEAKGQSSSNGIVERLVAKNMLLLDALHNSGAIEEDYFQFLSSMCPWCGASGGDWLIYEEISGSNGYRCTSCGHWAPY